MTNPHKFSPIEIEKAFAKSMLSEFSSTLRETLMQDAFPVDIPAGSTFYYEEDEPRCGLVVAGLIRAFMTAPDGRQITVRYVRPGELLGIAAIVGGPAPVSIQSLTDATLLMLNVQTLQKSAQSEPKVGWLMAQEITRRLYETLEALAGNTFGSLRQRLARHLLDLAASRQQGRSLVIKATQQELADAVGSVRPVVARILRDLRAEGIITTSSDGIIVLNPDELYANAWFRDV